MNYIISCDPGNGGTNAVLYTGKKSNKFVYFPSVRAAATGRSLGLETELKYEYIDWGTHRYIVGDDVIKVSKRNLERHMGISRYGNEFHRFLVATSIAKLGIKEGCIDLTLFAPPGVYLESKESILNTFKGEEDIKLKGDRSSRKWIYEDITVWPEGIGAAACFILDDEGNFVQSDALSGDTVIMDSGAYTFDVLQMSQGNFNPETLEHATWEDGGIDIHIRRPIVNDLKSRSDEFAKITVDDIDRVIRIGLVSEDYTLESGSVEVNIKPLIDKYCERYAEWVANNIVDGILGGFRGIKSVIMVGGGTTLISQYLDQYYPGKILDIAKYPHVKKIHPVDMNAVGGMRLALANRK